MDKHLYNTTTNVLTEAEQLWEKCLSIIKDNVNWRTFQTWFEPVKAVGLNDNVLTLQVPSQFFYEWLEEHYVELLGKTIKRVLGKVGRLEYRIMMESASSGPHLSNSELPSSKSCPSCQTPDFPLFPQKSRPKFLP